MPKHATPPTQQTIHVALAMPSESSVESLPNTKKQNHSTTTATPTTYAIGPYTDTTLTPAFTPAVEGYQRAPIVSESRLYQWQYVNQSNRPDRVGDRVGVQCG